MICIHHNKDLDGFTSGAIVKKKFPDCKLIGWDYKDPIPDFEQFRGEDVIMIDVSFPFPKLQEFGTICNLTLIDHHVSLKKDVDSWLNHDYAPIHTADMRSLRFEYVYEASLAACEVGWKHYFPEEPVPLAVKLLGEYDTWREAETERWYNEILPFQFYMRTVCTCPEDFPMGLLDNTNWGTGWADKWEFITGDAQTRRAIESGKMIVYYQEQQDMLACKRSAFERTFNGLRAICLNTRAFSTSTMKSVYDESKHDIMVGFEYTGRIWTVSLRSTKPEVDCSAIAKSRGGGGHKSAAGFEAHSLEEIFS